MICCPQSRARLTYLFISAAIGLVLSCSLSSGAAPDLEARFKEKVLVEINRVRHAELPITFDGTYFRLGARGFPHEQQMAIRYARLLDSEEGKKFLFVPRFGKTNTPGIDGRVFNLDATQPEKRVSLKFLNRLGNCPSLRLIKTVKEATEDAQKHSTLEGTFQAIFPAFRDEDLKQWISSPPQSFYNKIKLLAVMGVQTPRQIPTVVVVYIDDLPASEDLETISSAIQEKLISWEMQKPQEVILMTKDRSVCLLAGSDYSLHNSTPPDCALALSVAVKP